MKAVLKRSELLSHRSRLMVLRPPKKLLETAQVTISVSDKFSVTVPGFSHDMDCAAERWGAVSLPYKLWKNVIENMLPAIEDKEITIEAEVFQLEFGKTKIGHPQIKVTRLDKLLLEIPENAKPIEIVEFALKHDIRDLRGSVAWKTIQTAINQVRKQIERAYAPLKKYDVSPEELAYLVAGKRGIKDDRRFIDILFADN